MPEDNSPVTCDPRAADTRIPLPDGTLEPQPKPRRGLFSILLGFLHRKDLSRWTGGSTPETSWSSARGNFDRTQAYVGRKVVKKGKPETTPLENKPSAEREPELAALFAKNFPEARAEETRQYPAFQITMEMLLPALTLLRDQSNYNWPQHVTAIDFPEKNELLLTYTLRELSTGKLVALHLPVPRTGAKVPTSARLFAGFNWHEREVFELFGVTFSGHPDLRKLLLDSSYPGSPMLKGYKDDEHEFVVKPY